jgi:hypothetical protein
VFHDIFMKREKQNSKEKKLKEDGKRKKGREGE